MKKCGRYLIICLLLAALLLAVPGCGMDNTDTHEGEERSDGPDYIPVASFDGDKIGWPRLEVYVYPEDAYYYISVDPGITERITTEISENEKAADDKGDILGYAVALSPEPDSWNFLLQNTGGDYFWGDTGLSNDLGDALTDRAREATGWQLEGGPMTVEDISEISLYLGAECLETVTDTGSLADFEAYLHNARALGGVPKTANYRTEICCKLRNGETVSFIADADGDRVGLWAPPCGFYECAGTEADLLRALGLDSWPEKIREADSVLETETAQPYPREILDQLFDRVGGRIKEG